MKFFNNIKVLKKNSKEKYNIENIISKLPSSDMMAKFILNMLNNKRTKYIFDEDIKGNYYVYLSDTIYLSNKQNSKKNYERLCVISHECVHSIQPKVIQNLNFIFSNLELIMFVILVVLSFFKITSIHAFYGYLVINIIGLIFRLVLEMWATFKAPKIARNYLKQINTVKEDVETVYNTYSSLTKLLTPLFIIKLVFFKIVRIAIIYFINFKLFI